MATFALVHGAWHGGWCWERLTPELERRGHPSWRSTCRARTPTRCSTTTPRSSSTPSATRTATSSSSATRSAAARSRSSRRGARSGALVFLCGLLARARRERHRPALEPTEVFVPGFAGNSRHAEAAPSAWLDVAMPRPMLLPRLRPRRTPTCGVRRGCARSRRRPRSEPWPLDAIPDVERTSILCRDERRRRPDWSRRMSRERLGVEAVELDGGHSPFLSRPRRAGGRAARVADAQLTCPGGSTRTRDRG